MEEEIDEAEKADKVFKTYWAAFPYNNEKSYIVLTCKSGCELYIPFNSSSIQSHSVQNLKTAWQKLVDIAEY